MRSWPSDRSSAFLAAEESESTVYAITTTSRMNCQVYEDLPMVESQPFSIRLTDQERAILARLGRQWGPIKPLSLADVIRELIRRADEVKPMKRA